MTNQAEGVDGIRPPAFRGRNENLRFLNCKDDEIPARRKGVPTKYRELFDRLKLLKESGQAFFFETEDKVFAQRAKSYSYNVCDRLGFKLNALIRIVSRIDDPQQKYGVYFKLAAERVSKPKATK